MHLVELTEPLSYSQESAIGPHPESDPFVFLLDSFQYCPLSTPSIVLFLHLSLSSHFVFHVSHQEPISTSVPHMLTFSTFLLLSSCYENSKFSLVVNMFSVALQ